MTVRITMEGMTNTCMGVQCDMCHAIFPFIEGAVSHWQKFDRDGNCPDAPTNKEDES